jgi:adenosylhomocysteine nucleosidase
MDTPPRKVGIVAALRREVWPIIRHWSVEPREYDGRSYRFFANERAVLVCGGIGAESARRATEALIQLYDPSAVFSAGFAGALEPSLKAGTVVQIRRVIDAKDGSKADAPTGDYVLVSCDSVASVEQKRKLAQAYSAQLVDMEAAAVARAALTHAIPSGAVKAVSDEFEFELPPVHRFVTAEGRLRTVSFAVFALVRPWLWFRILRLARNSARASAALCGWLDRYNHEAEKLDEGSMAACPTVRIDT